MQEYTAVVLASAGQKRSAKFFGTSVGSCPAPALWESTFPVTVNFSRQVRRGAAWSYASQIVTTLGYFIMGVILARLIGPAEFGVFIAVTAFTSLFMMGVQFGLPQAIVQARTLTASEANAAFWSICALASVFIGIAISVAGPLGALYDSGDFASVMFAMCLVFVLTPFTSVGLALLRREMQFDRVAVINVASLVVAALVSIGVALLDGGVFSLVAGAVSSMLVTLLFLLHFIDWRPRSPRWSPVRRLLGYSGYATVNTILVFATERVDNILVGALLGTNQLGLYNRSYSLARIPSDQFAESLAPLMLGSLARIQDDVRHSRDLYFKAASAVTTLTMPFFVLLAIAGPMAIEFLYGEAWAGAGDPLRAMVPGAVFLMLTSTLKSMINAQGLVRQVVPLFAIGFVVTLLLVLALAKLGLLVIAIGISLREGLLFIMLVRLLHTSRIALGFSEIGYAVAPAMIAAILALPFGFGVMQITQIELARNPFLALLIVSIAIFGSYALIVLILMWTWSSHGPLRSTQALMLEVIAKALGR